MGKVRFGVIGAGNMGKKHIASIAEGDIAGAELCAVCDVKSSRLDMIKEEVKPEGVKYFTDSHELITSGLVDAVIIATPHYFHPTIGIDAFENGLHVLTEKPVGVYTKNVRELNEAARKSGKAFGIMFNQRTNKYYQKIREMVKSGELGEMKRCIWIITDWYRPQAYFESGGWRATWAGEGGGVLLNQCPHNLDLFQWIFGMPDEVYADCTVGKYHNIEVEDDVSAMFRYKNGASGVFITSTGECPGTNRLEISGSKGKVTLENGKFMYCKLKEDERKFTFEAKGGFDKIESNEEQIVIENGGGEQHRGILRNFTNHILNGEELLAPGYEGINSLAMSNAMMESSWKNEWIKLPNGGEDFLKMLEEKIKNSKVKEDVDVVLNTDGSYGTNK